MPMTWVMKRKIGCQAAVSVLWLAMGCMMLGGCRQDGGDGHTETVESGQQEEAGQPTASGPKLVETGAAKTQEENSLAEWEASLAAGEPDKLSAEAIRGVSVVRDGASYFAVSYEPRTYKNSFDCWAVSVPYQSMAVVDTEAMYDFFHVLADMELKPAGEIAREQTGLDDSSDSVYVAYYSGQTQEGGQAAPDRGISYRFGGQSETGEYYVEAGGGLWTADADTVERLFTVDPYDCILKVVSVVSVESVASVEIEFADSRHEMQVGQGEFWLDGKTVGSTEFYGLYTELMSVFIEKELPEDSAAGSSRELLMTVTYHRNIKEAPEITQRYYAYDETYASVQVNGTEFFLVSRAALGQLQERLGEAFGTSAVQ